jgi:hypothetical protein
MSKYSSYKSHQLITENWRRFLTEQTNEQIALVRKKIDGLLAQLGVQNGVGITHDFLVSHLIEPDNDYFRGGGNDWMAEPGWKKPIFQIVKDYIEGDDSPYEAIAWTTIAGLPDEQKKEIIASFKGNGVRPDSWDSFYVRRS